MKGWAMDEQLSKAISLFNSGKKQEAQTLLAEILKKDPSNSIAWYGMALCQKADDRVIYYLNKALSTDPKNERAKQLLIKVQTRSCNQNSPAEALKNDKIIDKNPKKCPRCGIQNSENSIYCYKCGSILDQSYERDESQDLRMKNNHYDKKNNLSKVERIILISGSVIAGLLILFTAAFLLLRRYLPSFPLPGNSYKREMVMIMQDLKTWQKSTNDFGSNYGSDLAHLQAVLIYGNELGRGWILEFFKEDQTYIDNLIEILIELSDQGKKILDTMNLVTPPEEIAASHNVIVQCIQERIAALEEQAIGLAALLPMGTEHSFAGPECYSFDAAVEKLSIYVIGE